jgi:hypothetical protein
LSETLIVEVLGSSNALNVRHVPGAAFQDGDVVGVDSPVTAVTVSEVLLDVYALTMLSKTCGNAYWKNVQTNPSGTCAQDTFLLRELRLPVRLMQLSETTEMVAQPSGGLIEPEQAIMEGDASSPPSVSEEGTAAKPSAMRRNLAENIFGESGKFGVAVSELA